MTMEELGNEVLDMLKGPWGVFKFVGGVVLFVLAIYASIALWEFVFCGMWSRIGDFAEVSKERRRIRREEKKRRIRNRSFERRYREEYGDDDDDYESYVYKKMREHRYEGRKGGGYRTSYKGRKKPYKGKGKKKTGGAPAKK